MAGTLTIAAVHPQGTPTPAGVLPAMRAGIRSHGLLLGAGLGAIALALLGQFALHSEPVADTVPLALQAAAAVLKQSAVRNGVVDGIRELPAAIGSGARRFELTIRMRDGTMRVTNETGGARWQAGDRVRLFGSAVGS